jgi:hypothetical protein
MLQESYKPLLFTKEKRGRLTIIDPNRPENNISGGTNQIETICDCFARAYDSLLESLRSFEEGDRDISFLQNLVGGNFDKYTEQREHLGSVYFGLTGQEPVAESSSKAQSVSFRTRKLRNSPH